MELIDQVVPNINEDIANGLVCKYAPQALEYIDSIFQTLARDFPEGLVYLGGRRCTPEEEYDVTIEVKKVCEVARNDLYLCVFNFTFKGEELKCHLLLPFVRQAGTIQLSGSKFVIAPILADRVISIGGDHIFVRLAVRAKPTFYRLMYTYRLNGVTQIDQIIWSNLYNSKENNDYKAKSSLPHYLFCKYGLAETFKKYANANPVIGTTEEINPVNYPSNEWLICRPNGSLPKGVTKNRYVRNNTAIAIRIAEFNETAGSLIAGFFYVADYFPTRMQLEYVNDPRMWRLLMGYVIFGSDFTEITLKLRIDDHIRTLDEYVDELTRIQLKDIGINVGTLYDFFHVLILNMNTWLLDADDKVATMYNKEFNILYYLLAPITNSIVRFYFKITNSTNAATLSFKDVQTAMKNNITPGRIYSIISDNGEVSTTSYPGDNAALKLTSVIIPQTSSNKKTSRGSDSGAANDPSKKCHVSIMDIGGYGNMPKNAPDGRSRVNIFALTDSHDRVQRHPDLVALLDSVQERISPKRK